MLTGENLRNGRDTCHSDCLSTANRTWTDLELNLGLFGERLASDRLSHEFHLQFLPHSEHTASGNTKRVKTRLEHVAGADSSS